MEPDRRGLAEGARWTVLRSRTPGFLRKPRGKGLIVIQRVSPGEELAWLDLSQNVEAGLRLEDEGRGTRATAFVSMITTAQGAADGSLRRADPARADAIPARGPALPGALSALVREDAA